MKQKQEFALPKEIGFAPNLMVSTQWLSFHLFVCLFAKTLGILPTKGLFFKQVS
jgi:hypothetical protein